MGQTFSVLVIVQKGSKDADLVSAAESFSLSGVDLWCWML